MREWDTLSLVLYMEKDHDQHTGGTTQHTPSTDATPKASSSAEMPSASIANTEIGSEETSASTPTSAMTTKWSKTTIVAGVIGIAGVLVAGYFFLGGNLSSLTHSTKNDDSYVATINGVGVERSVFDDSYASIEQNAEAQGIDTSSQETKALIKEQAINNLISIELLKQHAKDAGVTVDAADVDTQYSQLETQFGGAEALQTQMDTAGLTEDELRSNIEDQLLIDVYIHSELDLDGITVTDQEIEDFLASLNVADGTELPPMEEIRPQIEQQIIGQKQQELINGFIESLKDDASIEILI